jgi:hypothetical protein
MKIIQIGYSREQEHRSTTHLSPAPDTPRSRDAKGLNKTIPLRSHTVSTTPHQSELNDIVDEDRRRRNLGKCRCLPKSRGDDGRCNIEARGLGAQEAAVLGLAVGIAGGSVAGAIKSGSYLDQLKTTDE